MALTHALLANAVDPNDLIFKSSFERCDNISTRPDGAVWWDGGGDGESWNDPENWNDDVLPANGDDVWVADSGGITIVYNSAPDTLQLNRLDSCESLKITGGTLELIEAAWVRTNLELTGGNLVVIGGLAVFGQLQQSNGTLKGVGTATVGGLFTWTGGSQSEAGETVANGGVQLSGGVRYLNSRTLTLKGASTYSGGVVRLMNAATINLDSPLDIQTDDDILHYTGVLSTLNINSTITKSAGSDVTKLQGHFSNDGSIVVNSGEVWLGHGNGTGTSTGDFEVAAGAILGVSGNNTMTGASSFTGDGGLIYHGGGTTVIQGGYGLQGTLRVEAGKLSFANSVTIEDDVTITGGTLEYLQSSAINADVYLSNGDLVATASLPISGALQQSNGFMKGVGTVTVAGLFTWTGGSQSESGVTVANGGIQLSGGIHHLSFRTLTLNAASTYSGGAVRLMNGSTINFNSPFSIQTDEDIYHYTGVLSTLNINSTITKSAGSDVTKLQGHFNNNGAIVVNSGEIWLGHGNGTGTSTGDFEVAAGATLGVSGNNTMTGASSFTGDGGLIYHGGGNTVIQGGYGLQGTLRVEAGKLSFVNSVTIEDDVTVTGGTLEYLLGSTINADVYLTNGELSAAASLPISGALQQSNGTMKGIGTVTVAGLFTWTGGSQSESGVTVANGGLQMSGGIHHLNARTLTLNAASTYSGGGLRLMNSGTINFNSPFSIQTDEDIYHYTGTLSTLNINSTITKSAGSDVTKLEGHFNNDGTIVVNSGEIWLGRGTGTGTSTGAFEVAAGAILGVSGNNTMTGASSFTGDGGLIYHGGGTTVIQGGYGLQGTLRVELGKLSFANSVTIEEDVTVTGGTLEYLLGSTINADVYLTSGELIAAASLPISGALQQSNGTVKGVGTVTIAGLFTWTGGNQSESGVTVVDGGLQMSGGIHHLNARTLTLNAASTHIGGVVRLMNAATWNNNSSFDIQTDEDLSHYTGAVSTLNNNVGGTIIKSAGNADTVIGADVYNSGSISVTSGSLRFGRTFEQTDDGTLEVGIASGSFDSYAVAQAALLGGTLNITLEGGFEPALGATFDVMTFASTDGIPFDAESGLTIPNDKKFVVNYESDRVWLEVVADPP